MSNVAMIALLEGRYPAATRIISPIAWAPLTVGSGWASGPVPAEFRINSDGRVELRGQINGGAIPADFAVIVGGFTPFADVRASVTTTDTAGPTYDSGTLLVDVAGVMTIAQGIASIDEVNLDGVSWSVFE